MMNRGLADARCSAPTDKIGVQPSEMFVRRPMRAVVTILWIVGGTTGRRRSLDDALVSRLRRI